jgi:hypothetical protein
VIWSLGRSLSSIVGVAADVRNFGLDAALTPVVYFPLPAVARSIAMRVVIPDRG